MTYTCTYTAQLKVMLFQSDKMIRAMLLKECMLTDVIFKAFWDISSPFFHDLVFFFHNFEVYIALPLWHS